MDEATSNLTRAAIEHKDNAAGLIRSSGGLDQEPHYEHERVYEPGHRVPPSQRAIRVMNEMCSSV